MCQLQPQHKVLPSKKDTNTHTKTWLSKKIWPLPTPLVLAMLPFLPQSLYLNRGYTVWFHLTSFVYFFTRSSFIRKVLILQGLGICLGWYAAIAHDWYVEGTFCNPLYRNMPQVMVSYMVRWEKSLPTKIVIICLDPESSSLIVAPEGK